MYAVIATGGKQYRVEEGQQLDVERLGAPDDVAELDLRPVLLVDDDTVLATPDQLGGASVPRYDQRRVRRHDFERALHDRVERLVEVERRRQRSTDGLQRAHERRASMAFGHDGVKADDAHDGARVVTPRHVARGDPATAPLGGKLVSHVTGGRGLAAERACEL